MFYLNIYPCPRADIVKKYMWGNPRSNAKKGFVVFFMLLAELQKKI